MTTDFDMRRELPPLLDRLGRFCSTLTRDRDLADELVQETVARALRFEGHFEPGTNLMGWLITIAKREFYNWGRVGDRARMTYVDPQGYAYLDAASVGPAAPTRLALAEVLDAVELLPDGQREALMGYALGAEYPEIAAATGAPEGTVKSRISRARDALGRRFA